MWSGAVGTCESCSHHQLRRCWWDLERGNRYVLLVSSGKGVRKGGNLYLDMEVAIGSEVSGIRDGTVTSPGSMVSVNKYTMTT